MCLFSRARISFPESPAKELQVIGQKDMTSLFLNKSVTIRGKKKKIGICLHESRFSTGVRKCQLLLKTYFLTPEKSGNL